MKTARPFFLFFALLLVVSLACSRQGSGSDLPTSAPISETESGQAATLPPTQTPAPTLPPGPPPEPQEIVFTGGQGELRGRYYPAATASAPLVVLMHWVGGDMTDWNEIAVWLQNRGQQNPYPNPGTDPWWDSTWFPPVPPGRSYAVFIFSFTGCQPAPEGCQNWIPDVWLADAIAAMQKAAELPDVDPHRMAAIGSSIGADGAIDACDALNQTAQGQATCLGALSLSPGGYLNVEYSDAVLSLVEHNPNAVAWRLHGGDTAYQNLDSAGIPTYRSIFIPDGGHGNDMLRPGLAPLPMQLILDFLARVFGE